MLFLLALHVLAFAVLFHSQDDPTYLIPETEFDSEPKGVQRNEGSDSTSPDNSTCGITPPPRRRPTAIVPPSVDGVEEILIPGGTRECTVEYSHKVNRVLTSARSGRVAETAASGNEVIEYPCGLTLAVRTAAGSGGSVRVSPSLD